MIRIGVGSSGRRTDADRSRTKRKNLSTRGEQDGECKKKGNKLFLPVRQQQNTACNVTVACYFSLKKLPLVKGLHVKRGRVVLQHVCNFECHALRAWGA